MADRSKIEWTDATWNPIRARNRETGKVGHFCVHVSDGCRNCYAERMQRRFGNPIRYAAQDQERVGLVLASDATEQPLRWRRPRTVFVCSMTDLFGDWVPDEWIDRIFAVMALCPQHRFQVLTKRPERMHEYCGTIQQHQRWLECEEIAADWGFDPRGDDNHGFDWLSNHQFLPNVWFGVSIEDQASAAQRIPLLLDTPAAVRFVSYEPALGPVRVPGLYPVSDGDDGAVVDGAHGDRPSLDWVICGGESGPRARPMHPDWARSVRDQCRAAGVPFFFKQWGEWVPESQASSACSSAAADSALHLQPDGSIRVARRGARAGAVTVQRVGKRHAGRRLDGQEWNETP